MPAIPDTGQRTRLALQWILAATGAASTGLFLLLIWLVDTLRLGWGIILLGAMLTQATGAAIAFILIEHLITGPLHAALAGHRQKTPHPQTSTEQQVAALVRQISTGSNQEVLSAVEKCRARGWLVDGSLEGAVLSGCALQRAPLNGAVLPKVRLYKARLVRANLAGSNLQGAYLVGADLRGAILTGANLAGAHMQGANLTGAKGLSERQLASTMRLKGATMPDGWRYDGRYSLIGDLKQALKKKVQIADPQALADFYVVPLEDYLSGQQHWSEQAVRAGATPRPLT